MMTKPDDSTAEESSLSDFSTASTSTTSASASHSLLIVNSTGTAGTTVLQKISSHKQMMAYGMAKNIREIPDKTMKTHMRHTEMLIEGDERKASDIHRALELSAADTIVLCSGGPEAATALSQVLRHPPFRHIRVIVVSYASDEEEEQSRRRSLLGAGTAKRAEAKRTSMVRDLEGLKAVLFGDDHTIQERTTIVRPEDFNLVAIEEAKRQRRAGIFRRKVRSPDTASQFLNDIASWVADEVAQGTHQGAIVAVPQRVSI